MRESTDNEKVRKYHKDFYRPENLCVIITGQVKHADVFKALQPIEEKILAKVKQYFDDLNFHFVDIKLFKIYLYRVIEVLSQGLGKVRYHHSLKM